ncbi:unnamed protein product [Peniophora sp. CBMAI 1063]|nr:unnamed protein product [Peniophora sp. CBMAI 1063]
MLSKTKSRHRGLYLLNHSANVTGSPAPLALYGAIEAGAYDGAYPYPVNDGCEILPLYVQDDVQMEFTPGTTVYRDSIPVVAHPQIYWTDPSSYTSTVLFEPSHAPEPEPELYWQPPPYHLSSTFRWDAVDPEGNIPDTDLIADDGVHFAAHFAKLDSSSYNGFGGLLVCAPVIPVPLSSTTLNLILHAMYGLSPARYTLSVDELARAVDALEFYGLPKAVFVSPAIPLFQIISQHAPAEPLACYALAAHAELDKLAIIVSPYTLAVSLSDISDECATRIGPCYLKRLFFLHLGRVEALKRLLLPPPGPHPPADECTLRAQRQLNRAWTTVVAEMTWTLSAGITVSMLDKRFKPVEKDFTSAECRKYLLCRIQELLVQRSLVKGTI